MKRDWIKEFMTKFGMGSDQYGKGSERQYYFWVDMKQFIQDILDEKDKEIEALKNE